MGMKAGIRTYGEEGVKSILKEMKEFHDREVVNPLRLYEITPEIRKKALGYPMFLKMKTNGEIKARGCADGRPQRIYKTNRRCHHPQYQLS